MKKEIKEIFDMGLNANVSNYIDYDVIDYNDGTFLGIEECEEIYKKYEDFIYDFLAFTREFGDEEESLPEFKKEYPQYADFVKLDHAGNMEVCDLQDFASDAIDEYLRKQRIQLAEK